MWGTVFRDERAIHERATLPLTTSRFVSRCPCLNALADFEVTKAELNRLHVRRRRERAQRRRRRLRLVSGQERALFRLYMLQARPTLGVCFLSQPYFVPLFWLCLVHVRSAVEFPSHASSANFLP